MDSFARLRVLPFLLSALFATAACAGQPQAAEPVLALARQHEAPLLETLRTLCSIESGSRDIDGLEKAAQLVANRLKALGGEVELVDGNKDIHPMAHTPDKVGRAVRATFRGTGSRKILMLAHMDTVYLKGMLEKQPFRIEGDKAYGLAIADGKQGIATIFHTIAMLRELGGRGRMLHFLRAGSQARPGHAGDKRHLHG